MSIKQTNNTKDLIMNLLKKETTLAVNDLTDRLNITHMAVRKHLSVLERDELIKSQEMKKPMGRPLQVYSLTQKGERLFPEIYEEISVEFLKDIQELHGEESIQHLFRKREQRLSEEYKKKIQHKPITEKVNEIAKLQNEKGYMASVNRLGEHSFELVEYNCPIYSIAKEFKIACQCETNMFKDVLELDKVERFNCKTEGDDHCRFLFNTKNET